MEFIKTSLLLRFFVFIFLPLLLLTSSKYQDLKKYSVPQSEQFSLNGLNASIDIRYEENGVPFIKADSPIDAYLAVGFVHARDRLWQMEIFRRIASGRLSEILGGQFVERDAWFRTLGIPRASEESWDALDNLSQESLTLYTMGVNQWIENSSSLPPEFQLLGLEPEPWTVYDSLSVMKLLGHNLGGNLRDELAYLVSRKLLNDEQLQVFFPELNNSGTGSAVPLAQIELDSGFKGLEGLELLDSIRKDLGLGGRNVGSNAWVVSGEYTASGSALLANDPHLGIQVPSLWYTLRVNADEWNVAGQSIPGLPLVVFGRNKNIAWGGTNLMADQQDLHIEKINPSNLAQYLGNEEWVNFESRQEMIYVSRPFPAMLHDEVKPIEITVTTTRNGPMVSELLGLPDLALSLNWPVLNGDTSYQGFFKVNFATNWEEFRASMAEVGYPSLNMLYADVEGNIGHQAIGKIQKRRSRQGLLPQIGWDHASITYVPFEDLPREFNPERGYIANANNQVVDESYPHYISSDWADPARVVRIKSLLYELIAEKKPIDIKHLANIQTDNIDLYSLEILSGLPALQAQSERQAEALSILENWNGSYEIDSYGASIYHAWHRNLLNRLFADELSLPWTMKQHSGFIDGVFGSLRSQTLLDIIDGNHGGFCDNETIQTIETCEHILLIALDDALDELSKLAGPNMKDWRWGNLHIAIFSHLPFSNVKVLERFFERSISSPGTNNTINATSAEFDANVGYIQNTGPGFRQVIQLSGDMSNFHYINSTGQSGHPLSPHYDNMIKPFRNGLLFELPASPADYSNAHITLMPN